MSFWKFGFAQASNIDTLLATVPTDGNNTTPLVVTLDQLLDEDDLIQECKSGHAKLADFLARPAVLKRILDYVDGSAFDSVSPAAADDEEKLAQRKHKFGHVCTEILSANIHLVNQELCTNLDHYLCPFWLHVLEQPPTLTLSNSMQLAYWAKVNTHLINTRPQEFLSFFRSNDRFVPLMVKQIGSASIVDVLFRILSCEVEPHGKGIIDHLSQQQLIPQLISRLSPRHSPYTHLSVSEFLKAVINFCSTENTKAATELATPISALPGSAPLGSMPHTKWGQVNGAQSNASAADPEAAIWPSMQLLRDLSSAESIHLLLRFTLDDVPLSCTPTAVSDEHSGATLSSSTSSFDLVTPRDEKAGNEQSSHFASTALGSKPSSPVLSSDSGQSHHKLYLPTQYPDPDEQASPETATSSLSHCLSIITDLIRKINSDFTEQQILHYYRKHQVAIAQDASLLLHGPSIVDFGPMLIEISARLPDLNQILLSPISDISPLPTPLGAIKPLRQERFRICELYAELLNCSNMALVNRAGPDVPRYDSEGRLQGGMDSLLLLERALRAHQPLRSSDQEEDTSSLASRSETNDDDASVATSTYKSTARSNSEGSVVIATAFEDISLESTSPGHILDQDVCASPPSGKLYPAFGESNGDAALQAQNQSHGDQQAATPTTPGYLFKSRFLQEKGHVVLFDLFFAHPWHSFLHHVVYDLIEQIFAARMDVEINRDICLDVFVSGHLTDRILQAQRDNDIATTMPKAKRLGYMGHLSLVAEEIVKVFQQYPRDVYIPAATSIRQPDWDIYVSTVLRHTREKDLQQLGGGISVVANDTISSSEGFSDDDEEFPLPSSRSNGRQASDIESRLDGTTDGGTAVHDQFARYLAHQISNDLPDKFSSSSDEEDEDNIAEWMNSSGFDPKDSDFQLGADDDEFGTFAPAPVSGLPGSSTYRIGDPFEPSLRPKLTAADWNSEIFKSDFDFNSHDPDGAENPFASAEDEDGDDRLTEREGDSEDDEFGDFSSAPNGTVSWPSMDAPTTDFEDAFNPSARERIREDGLVDVQVDEETRVVVPKDEVEVYLTKGQHHMGATNVLPKSVTV